MSGFEDHMAMGTAFARAIGEMDRVLAKATGTKPKALTTGSNAGLVDRNGRTLSSNGMAVVGPSKTLVTGTEALTEFAKLALGGAHGKR